MMKNFETERLIQSYLVELGIRRTVNGFPLLTYCLQDILQEPCYWDLHDIILKISKESNLNLDYRVWYQRCRYAIKNSSDENIRAMSLLTFLCFASDNLKLRQRQKEQEVAVVTA